MGWPSVAWGLARISSHEITEWMAYEEVEGPLGPARLDHHFATLMALVANLARGKADSPVEPGAFLPWLDGGEQRPNHRDTMFDEMWTAMRDGA